MSSYTIRSEKELLALLQTGEHEAFTIIFHRYKEILFRHAFQMLQDLDEAEDVVQEVFLMLWQKKETLVLTDSLSAYLYRSVRNRILNIMTHQQVVGKYLKSIQSFIAEGHYSTDEKVRENELARILEREIDELPPRMREVFLLSREEGLSHKEIASRLGISDKTVKLQVTKTLKILKGRINSILFIFHLF